MSREETIQKAYGSIPKEVGLSFGSWAPTCRGFKYYWLVLVRKLKRMY